MKNNGVLEYRSSGGMNTEKEQSPGFVPLVTIWNVNGGEILENGEYRKKCGRKRLTHGRSLVLGHSGEFLGYNWGTIHK